jgi:phage shock protein A
MVEITVSVLGIVGTLSSIIFAYLAFRRNDKKDIKTCATQEAELLSDMKWLKSSVSRMEKKIDRLDSNYNELLSRIIKVEERLDNHIRCEK